mgnify:FL=1
MTRWRPTPGTGRWWALGLAFTLAFTAWASWRVLSVSSLRITVDETGYTIVDERTVTLTFLVTKPVDTIAVCTVQAKDLRKNVVGSATVDIPAANTRTTAHTATIKTTTSAFTALVHDCVRG